MQKTVVILKEDLSALREVVQTRFGGKPMEIILWSELKGHTSPRALLGFMRRLRCYTLGIGFSDLDSVDKHFFYKLLLLCSNAKERLLFDSRGQFKMVSLGRFALADVPLLFLEFASSLVLIGAVLGVVRLLYHVCLKKQRSPLPLQKEKKVGYIRTHFFRTILGGTLAHTTGIIEGFHQNGYPPVIVSSDCIFDLENYPQFHCVPPSTFFRNLREIREMVYNLKLIWVGFRILKREKPDFLYYRHTSFCFAPLVLARLLRIPLVLEFNSSDYWRAEFWKDRKYYFPGLLLQIERLNLTGADLVVTVSEACRRQILDMVQGCEEKVLVNPNSVNPEKFRPEISGNGVRTRLKIGSEQVVVGYSGTFMVYHGVEILAQAILELKHRRKLDRFCFLMLGEGGLQEKIRKFLTDNGCTPAVRFTGAIPFNDIQDYLATCDILVSPHNPPPADVEFFGSPIKIFEYMAMGKAIVASRIGQMAEVLTDGEDSLLVPPGDVEAIVEAILRLADEPELRQRLGANARGKVVFHYTWQQNVRKVLDRLEQVMPVDEVETVLILKDREEGLVSTVQRRLGTSKVTVFPWTEVMAYRSFKHLIHYVRNFRSNRLILGVPDLGFFRNPLSHKALLLLSWARECYLIDAKGRIEKVTWLSFATKDLPLFLLAGASGIPALLLAYLSVLFLSLLPRRKKWNKDIGSQKAVAYLRVHFFKVIFGGTLAHTQGVLEGFQDNGYQVILISSDRMLGWDQYQLGYLIHPPLLYRDFPEVQEVVNNFKLILKGWRILRKHRPSLIYQRHQGFTFAGIFLSRLLSVPLVVEFNSSDYYRAQRWKEHTYRLSRLLRFTEGLTLSKADLVVAVSAPLKRQILSFNGTEPERVLVQPNGVNPIKFTPMIPGDEVRARLSIPCESIVVGFAGSLMPYMGIDVLIDAASEIGRRRSEILNPPAEVRDLHFLIIGDGRARVNLEQRAESKNLKLTRIHFTGAVPFTEVEKYLAACDILVSPHNPSLDPKDFYWSPIKMFEYMAMGKAIIATRIGQMAEVLSDGEDALLVAPGDVAALADAIVRLMKDRDLRIRLGANARQKVTSHYTWRQNVKNVLDELGRVMETGKTARE